MTIDAIANGILQIYIEVYSLNSSRVIAAFLKHAALVILWLLYQQWLN